ncbi:MAG: hypothetical protein ILM98_07640 [Kiritimatiellae bacterium]|nr:hypothetical protein [Kiritimatiellia bacterium]
MRIIAFGLAAIAPMAAAIVIASFSPRMRAAMTRQRACKAVAVIGSLVMAGAFAVALALPGTRRALAFDRDGLLLAIPAMAVLCAATLAQRRPAAIFIVAALSVAALPFLKLQGNEVFVGIWSLRRSLPFLTLLPLAAFHAAFDAECAPWRIGLWLRRAAVALVPVCAAAQLFSMPLAYGGGGEWGAPELIGWVEKAMQPDALYLFARIGESAPFATTPGRDVFGLNDTVSNAIKHGPVVDWLREEARRRQVYVVALDAVPAPIAENGIVLCPEGDPIWNKVLCTAGGSFGTAKVTGAQRTFAFLHVYPADSKEGVAALRGGTTLRPGLALPFGMAPGGWDVPRRDKPGRWACDGAAFWGPVPAPGESVEIAFSASWWTRDGLDAPPQELRLEAPFPCAASSETEVELKPGKEFQRVHGA